MVMLQPSGKAKVIAEKVLKNKGISKPKKSSKDKNKISGPYLLH